MRSRSKRTRDGTSLVEVMIGVSILAGALVPIASYFVNSGTQQANLKAESIAAGFAAKMMNRFLEEETFDQVTTQSGSETAADYDGTRLEWDLRVEDHMPSGIQFTYDTTVSPETPPGGLPAGADVLDRKSQNDIAIKDIYLTVRWASPRDTTIGGPSRTQVLVSRRARL